MSELEHVKCATLDLAVENAAKLIKLFPEVEGERGTVDLDKLRQVLSSQVIEGNVERYQFTRPGKRKADNESRQRRHKNFSTYTEGYIPIFFLFLLTPFLLDLPLWRVSRCAISSNSPFRAGAET